MSGCKNQNSLQLKLAVSSTQFYKNATHVLSLLVIVDQPLALMGSIDLRNQPLQRKLQLLAREDRLAVAVTVFVPSLNG